jgi:flagellar biosynthesis/type III secretory pathway ATPase
MEELIKIGAYRAGADPITDRAIALNPALEIFWARTRTTRRVLPIPLPAWRQS